MLLTDELSTPMSSSSLHSVFITDHHPQLQTPSPSRLLRRPGHHNDVHRHNDNINNNLSNRSSGGLATDRSDDFSLEALLHRRTTPLKVLNKRFHPTPTLFKLQQTRNLPLNEYQTKRALALSQAIDRIC